MTGKIKLVHSGGNAVSIAVPTSNPSSSEVEFKLPQADGSANQVLKTDGSGNLSFGADQGGKILQVVESADFSSTTTTSSTTFQDTGLTVSITPSSSSSKILVNACGDAYISGTGYNVYGEIRLVRGSTEIAKVDHQYDSENSSFAARLGLPFSLNKLDSPNTTSATTYKIQIRVSGTNYSASIKLPSSTSSYGGNRIQVLEVAA